MNNWEIKEKIDANNKLISQALNPSTFVLNSVVADLLFENKKLQGMCTHDYDENGFCRFCYKLKEGEND